MKIINILLLFHLLVWLPSFSNSYRIEIGEDFSPYLMVNGEKMVCAPSEGLWSIATGWADGWPCAWKHVNPRTKSE